LRDRILAEVRLSVWQAAFSFNGILSQGQSPLYRPDTNDLILRNFFGFGLPSFGVFFSLPLTIRKGSFLVPYNCDFMEIDCSPSGAALTTAAPCARALPHTAVSVAAPSISPRCQSPRLAT